MMRTVLNRTSEVLSKDGTVPVAVVISILSSRNNYWEVFDNPISSIFFALLGATIFEGSFYGPQYERMKPWIAGGLLLVASGKVVGRGIRKWNSWKNKSKTGSTS